MKPTAQEAGSSVSFVRKRRRRESIRVTRINVPRLSLFLATISLWGMIEYMNIAAGKINEVEVVWRGTKAYDKRVTSFDIKPEKAFEIAWREYQKSKHDISRKPEFIVGRWYWFGRETKTDAPLAGYYVNGDDGRVEYRQSEKTMEAGAKHLPRDAWRMKPKS